MKIGTRSLLCGAHCFFIHPWFVALAWYKLWGFPKDIRLWFAFFLHDIGYWGKPNMDGAEGETHVELGAKIMHRLFDTHCYMCERGRAFGCYCEDLRHDFKWHDFCLYHSRYYARKANKPFSRLCVADKLAFAMTPKWLYLPMVWLTGELKEYMSERKYKDGRENDTPSEWYDRVATWVVPWAKEQANGTSKT